jgi:hypothetical protein
MTNTAVDLKADVVRPITLAEKSALERLVAMVKETKDKPFCGDLGKFERELKERLDAVGRDVVGDEIAKAEINAPAVRIGRTEYRRVLEDSPETYMTTFGPVSVHRTLYKDREDPLERAVAMLELRVGIVGGFWTPEAAKQATWVVAQMTPGLGEELFRRLGHMGPSKSSLDRLPKEISARWEDDRKAFEAQLRTTLVVPSDAATVAPSLDGVLVPMNDVAEDRAEKRTKGASKNNRLRFLDPCGFVSFVSHFVRSILDGRVGVACGPHVFRLFHRGWFANPSTNG